VEDGRVLSRQAANLKEVKPRCISLARDEGAFGAREQAVDVHRLHRANSGG
jgi:hypothetical protein